MNTEKDELVNSYDEQDFKQEQDQEQKGINDSIFAEKIDLIATLVAERNDYKDRWLRQIAEVENFKKRAEREKNFFLHRANEDIIKDLLPVLDDLERALLHTQNIQENNPLIQGISMTHKELIKVLERHGLEKVETIGQAFNPQFHEAILQGEKNDQEENIILNELSKGYILHGRLLRPAMVVVNKKTIFADNECTEKL